jgi:hypothetical protein
MTSTVDAPTAPTALRVLVLEDEPGSASAVAAALRQSGHTVDRCHEEGLPAFPCNGILDGSCPIDRRETDVAVVVRRHVNPQALPSEDGVACAIRHAVPVVLVGPDALNPSEDWLTAAVDADGDDDVVKAVEEAAAAAMDRHRLAALRTVHQFIDGTEIEPADCDVTVTRAGEGLRVLVSVPGGRDADPTLAMSARVAGAVRAVDPVTPRIDVQVVGAPGF